MIAVAESDAKTYLLLLFRKLVPPLVHFKIDGVLFQYLAGPKSSFQIGPDNGPRSLRIQEGGSKRLLGRIGVFLLLLAFPLLVLSISRWAFCLVGGIDGLRYTTDGGGRSFHGCVGGGGNVGRKLELLEISIFAGQDRGGVLHVGAQQLIDVGLDMGEAGLEAGERHDDLAAQGMVSSCAHINGLGPHGHGLCK